MILRKIKCPYCGSEFHVPETVSIAVCPYCGSTVWIETGEMFKEHYIYDIQVEYNQAYTNAIGIAQRQFASPEDLSLRATPSEGMLHFVPLYLFHVDIRARCPDNPEAGIEEKWVSLLATSNPPKGLTNSYKFPTRGRRFFEPRILERGKYHQPDRDPRDLLELAIGRSRIRALEEAYNECDNPRLQDNSKWLGIVHYPFWQVGYKYLGKDYYALVDATDGTVVYLEYPIGSKKRSLLLGGSVALVVAGMAIGSIIGYYIDPTLAGAGSVGGFVSGLAGVINFLELGVSRKGTYRLEG